MFLQSSITRMVVHRGVCLTIEYPFVEETDDGCGKVRGITLVIDADPRKLRDKYILIGSRGKELLRLSLPKLETWLVAPPRIRVTQTGPAYKCKTR